MKKVLLVLTLLAFNAQAQEWANPYYPADMDKNEVNEVHVKIQKVNDVNAACNAERKKRGRPVFNFSVDACSFWVENTCTIVVPRKTNTYILGHEFRHCIQGAFH